MRAYFPGVIREAELSFTLWGPRLALNIKLTMIKRRKAHKSQGVHGIQVGRVPTASRAWPSGRPARPGFWGQGSLWVKSMSSKKVCPVLTPAPANGRLSVIGVLADAVRLGRGHWGGP